MRLQIDRVIEPKVLELFKRTGSVTNKLNEEKSGLSSSSRFVKR